MEKLDSLVAEYIEQRLLEPKRLEQLLSHVLHRRTERAERRKIERAGPTIAPQAACGLSRQTS
jgi:hypothetical protein